MSRWKTLKLVVTCNIITYCYDFYMNTIDYVRFTFCGTSRRFTKIVYDKILMHLFKIYVPYNNYSYREM